MKRCTVCGELKSLNEFYPKATRSDGRRSDCKSCGKNALKNYYHSTPDFKVRSQKSWKSRYQGDPLFREKIKRRNLRHSKKPETKIKIRAYSARPSVREKAAVYARNRFKSNPEAHDARKTYMRRYMRERNHIPKWNISNRMRAGIALSLRSKKEGRKWAALVGYSIIELMERLEALFSPGMTWDNIGEWQLDHIRPVSSFNFSSTDDFEFQQCWGLEYLQPLWAKDNQKKGRKWYGQVKARGPRLVAMWRDG